MLAGRVRDGKGPPISLIWVVAQVMGCRIRCAMGRELCYQVNGTLEEGQERICKDCIYGPECLPLQARLFFSAGFDNDGRRFDQFDLFMPERAGTLLLGNENGLETCPGPLLYESLTGEGAASALLLAPELRCDSRQSEGLILHTYIYIHSYM